MPYSTQLYIYVNRVFCRLATRVVWSESSGSIYLAFHMFYTFILPRFGCLTELLKTKNNILQIGSRFGNLQVSLSGFMFFLLIRWWWWRRLRGCGWLVAKSVDWHTRIRWKNPTN